MLDWLTSNITFRLDLPTLEQLAVRGAAFLLVIAIHGWALAAIARLLGDRGPVYDGKLTANPLVHLDLIALLAAMLRQLGWSRPIAIDPAELRLGRFGLVVCVLGSLAALLAALFLLRLLRPLAVTSLSEYAGLTVVLFLNTAAQVGTWYALLNLLPFPPLTGAHLLVAIAPRLRARLPKLHTWGVLLLVLLLAAGILPRVLRPLYDPLAALLFPR